MNIACCGLGVNSIAGIIEATNRGVIFDHILFANTGNGKKLGEKKATYAYIEIFNKWLKDHNQPQLTILHSYNKDKELITLYEEVLKLDTLPSIVFGYKTCSQRFKIAPQDKFIDSLPEAQVFYEAGLKVKKWIFYDADEPQRAKEYISDKYENYYFLIEIDFGRFECIYCIGLAGLPIPPKSSCKFCPSTKPYQIIEMYEESRSDFYESVILEANALNGGKLINVLGLGSDWSWWEVIKAYRYLSFVKRAYLRGEHVKIHPDIKNMIKRVNRSKPERLKPSIERNKPTEVICDIFKQRKDTPCGCYDG